jgi:hypothetical protein
MTCPLRRLTLMRPFDNENGNDIAVLGTIVCLLTSYTARIACFSLFFSIANTDISSVRPQQLLLMVAPIYSKALLDGL